MLHCCSFSGRRKIRDLRIAVCSLHARFPDTLIKTQLRRGVLHSLSRPRAQGKPQLKIKVRILKYRIPHFSLKLQNEDERSFNYRWLRWYKWSTWPQFPFFAKQPKHFIYFENFIIVRFPFIYTTDQNHAVSFKRVWEMMYYSC